MNYVAGIDGGGTRTSVIVARTDGEIVCSFTAGPLNYNGQDEAVVASSLQEITERTAAAIAADEGSAQLNRQHSEEGAGTAAGLASCQAICIGAAGISNPLVAGRLTSLLRARGYLGEPMLVGDHETALCGAHGGRSGLILIAGTGTICYGQGPAGDTHRAGGYGHLIDDGGSGYAIGRDLLAAVVQAADGRTGPTLITELVYERLAVSTVPELIGYVYDQARSKRDIASLAPLLSVACESGDEQALLIAGRSADALLQPVAAVAERLGMQAGPLALLGSVLFANRHIRDALHGRIAERYPQMVVTEPQHDASYGAVLLAIKQLRRGGVPG
ncbi:N-acetylglucosamine kinase [Paenibacillus sp. 1P07SE]|uniref:N-acetylglucosamine kinase n=1 Tax=Paenibacillus sp. 1P07SE TaxID=3132209 RepID=UPI0039A76238